MSTAPKFDFTAIPLCGIDGAESTSTLCQDSASMTTTTEPFEDQSLKASDMVASKDDASVLGGESDDVPSSVFIHSENDVVPSSAFIHDDDYETVEHGIFPSTTETSDDLSDFCHHIESESASPLAPYMMSCPNSHVRRATTTTT